MWGLRKLSQINEEIIFLVFPGEEIGNTFPVSRYYPELYGKDMIPQHDQLQLVEAPLRLHQAGQVVGLQAVAPVHQECCIHAKSVK